MRGAREAFPPRLPRGGGLDDGGAYGPEEVFVGERASRGDAARFGSAAREVEERSGGRGSGRGTHRLRAGEGEEQAECLRAVDGEFGGVRGDGVPSRGRGRVRGRARERREARAEEEVEDEGGDAIAERGGGRGRGGVGGGAGGGERARAAPGGRGGARGVAPQAFDDRARVRGVVGHLRAAAPDDEGEHAGEDAHGPEESVRVAREHHGTVSLRAPVRFDQSLRARHRGRQQRQEVVRPGRARRAERLVRERHPNFRGRQRGADLGPSAEEGAPRRIRERRRVAILQYGHHVADRRRGVAHGDPRTVASGQAADPSNGSRTFFPTTSEAGTRAGGARC